MAEIDVRNGATTDVTSIRYSANQVIEGSAASSTIVCKDSNNVQMVVCNKGKIDDMIAALQLAKKLW